MLEPILVQQEHWEELESLDSSLEIIERVLYFIQDSFLFMQPQQKLLE